MNKDLLYRTGNSTHYSLMAYMGKKNLKKSRHMHAQLIHFAASKHNLVNQLYASQNLKKDSFQLPLSWRGLIKDNRIYEAVWRTYPSSMLPEESDLPISSYPHLLILRINGLKLINYTYDMLTLNIVFSNMVLFLLFTFFLPSPNNTSLLNYQTPQMISVTIFSSVPRSVYDWYHFKCMREKLFHSLSG